MWNNIRYEGAVLSPLTSFKTSAMEEQGGQAADVKDSYELYDSQKRNDHLFEGTMNGTGAPGSPGSIMDYKQLVNSLQKELEDRRKREAELQQFINSLKSSPGLSDSQYMQIEGSQTNDSLGENVKDAHIKYLQRQVTVLQANMYKSEQWSSRFMIATKEKDEALDELAALKHEMKALQDDNTLLQTKLEALNGSYLEAQKRHQQSIMELDNLRRTNCRAVELVEELSKYKAENCTLKESLSRLETENKSLKEYSLSGNGNSQSLGNVACSQELEYLHKVVDTLKSTVMEQRYFLLNMRSPNSLSGKNGTPPQSANATGGPSGNTSEWSNTVGRESPGIKSRQPLQSAGPGDAAVQRFLPPTQPPTLRQSTPDLTNRVESGNNVWEVRSSPTHKGSSVKQMPAASGGLLEMTGDGPEPGNMDTLKSQNAYSNGMARNLSRPTGTDSQKPPQKSSNGMQAMGDSGRLPIDTTGYVPMLSPRHYKATQSEILSRRIAEEQSNQNFLRSKSATIAHNPEKQNQGELQKQQIWPVKPDQPLARDQLSHDMVQLGASATTAPSHMPVNESKWEASKHGVDEQQENMYRSYENMKSPIIQQQKSQLDSYRQGQQLLNSGRALKVDTLIAAPTEGNNVAQPRPPAHRLRSQLMDPSRGLYINTVDQVPAESLALVDPDQPRLNSDKLCPVCNKDFSRVSMEDFQTHVFKCFDDENAPETMKPQETSRVCPMCSKSFDCNTPQVEYEKHVHSHFGEDGPGEHFEILQPSF
ncbi:unnamed protein product [Lymnaea stagnalis]|uniref:UBZ1-type domain-containing protein n=1 Tax=Lymnaea stagnalis TaxID=6523 RepID=A0AAV2IKJ6_LYMST